MYEEIGGKSTTDGSFAPGLHSGAEPPLPEQFTRIAWLLQRYNQINYGPIGDPYRGQGRVLALLNMQPEISQRRLAYLLNIQPQSLGELLAKLENNGYITRVPSENDRRGMVIRITDAGREAAIQGEQKRRGGHRLFDCLSREEIITLRGYLNRVIQSLEKKIEIEKDKTED